MGIWTTSSQTRSVPRTAVLLILGLMLLSGIPGSAKAQEVDGSLSFQMGMENTPGGLGTVLSGDAGLDFDFGLQLLAGLDYTYWATLSHGCRLVENADCRPDEDLGAFEWPRFWSMHIEPRFRFSPFESTSIRPFLGGKLGFVQWINRTRISAEYTDEPPTGREYGVVAGFELFPTASLGLEVRRSYGAVTRERTRDLVDTLERYGVRAGIRVHF